MAAEPLREKKRWTDGNSGRKALTFAFMALQRLSLLSRPRGQETLISKLSGEQRIYRQYADRVVMKRDLQIAREIQMWLLPVNPPQVPGMEIGWLRGRSVNTTAPRRAMESAVVRQSPNPSTTAGAISEKTKPRVLNTVAHQARRKRPAVSVASAGSLPPDGFRTLMYCDQLSCAEAMEIIRVQLPTSIAGLTPASTTTNDVVLADVLVGPDGIARGIRIVE